MRASPGMLHINKIAAAIRQLDAAIRMFFAKEDELATHTVASAAFRILRDVTGKRGKNALAQLVEAGVYEMARLHGEGKLPEENRVHIESIPHIEKIVKDVREQGEEFDRSRISILVNRTDEERVWPSEVANFLKHADRDPEEHLAVDEIKTEDVLMGACSAYLGLMRMPTPEIRAFYAFGRRRTRWTPFCKKRMCGYGRN